MADDQNLQAAQVAIGVMQQMQREMNNLKNKAKEVTESSGGLAKINTMFEDMAKKLVGPVGVAAGFYAVAKSIAEVAQSSVQLESLAKNTGLTADNVRNMQTQFRMMGLSTQEANASISALGGKLNNLLAFQTQSELFQRLSQSRGGAVFGLNLIEMEKAGNRLGTITEIMKVFNAQDRRGKIALAEAFQMTIDQMERLNTSTLNHARAVHVDEEELRKYHETWVEFGRSFEDIKEAVSSHATKIINEMIGAATKEGATAQHIVDNFNALTDAALGTLKNTIREIEGIMAWWEAHKGTFEKLKILEDPKAVRRALGDAVNRSADLEQLGVGLMDPLAKPKGWTARGIPAFGGGTHGDITDFGGMRRTDELIDVERGSNKALQDIRDILQGNAPEGGGGAGGSGGYSSDTGGGGRRALSRAIGMDKGGPYKDVGGDLPPAVGDQAGINRDFWKNQLDNDPSLKERLFRHSLGENTDPRANQAIMEEAANRAGIRGINRFDEKGNLSYFQGYYRGNLGPYRAMLERNYNKVFGEGSDIAGGAIDNSSQGLSAKHERTGRFRTVVNFGGDRITGHHGVESFEVPGWGESGRGERANWPAFRQQQLEEAQKRREARGQVDKSQSMSTGVWGGINAYVEFKNVPPGVATHADTEGDVFKELQINKTKQAGVYRQPGSGYE